MFEYKIIKGNNKSMLESGNIEELIIRNSKEGWRFIDAIGKSFGSYGQVKEYDLVFERRINCEPKYFLEVWGEERHHKIGIFNSEDSIKDFLSKIEFLKIERDIFDGYEYVNYYMNYEDIPDYYEVEYRGYIYILSRHMFVPTKNTIDFIWNPIHSFDDNLCSDKRYVDEATQVDAYVISNCEAKEYIEQREFLYGQVESYYKEQGYLVTRNGQGSEDGEYILIEKDGDQRYLLALDPLAVEEWNKSKDINTFVDKYIDL